MMIGMALRELASDLKAVADRLAAVAANGDDPVISGPVKAGADACSKVERAWSRSWLGYHSRVYYTDFAPPPPGARFSSEWGFMPAFGNSTQGDWREYRHEDVIDAIEEIAGNPDLSAAQDYEKRALADLEDGKASVVSILTTALSIHDDPLVREALGEAKSMEPFTQYGVARMQMPSTLMSRDSAAMNEGPVTPAHISYRAGIVQMTDPGRRCGDLGKLAHRMADHLGRMSETDSRPAKPWQSCLHRPWPLTRVAGPEGLPPGPAPPRLGRVQPCARRRRLDGRPTQLDAGQRLDGVPRLHGRGRARR